MNRDALPRLAWEHPVSVLMLFLALLVVGAIGYARIPVQMMPDGFEPRFLWVAVPFPNATPSEADERVVRVVEEELSTLPGLKSMQSRARTDQASFELEFHPSVPMDVAYDDTLDRLERAFPSLPDEVERFLVFKYNPSDEPVLWTGVTFPDDVDDPYRLLQDVIIPRIERVPGVANVETWGVDARRVFVDYDRERLLSHAIDLGSVQRRLATDNFQMSGGRIVEGGTVRHVRSLARVPDVATLERLPIDGKGRVLADIADISVRGVTSGAVDRVDGRRAGALGVRKESSANTVEVAAAVRRVLEELQADPRGRGAAFHVFFDQGELVGNSLATLRDATLQGGVLSIVILFVFLREWRMTLLISAAIPFSLLLTVAWLYAEGSSLHLVAMMGLLLAVGMVVDNAIVVIESIYAARAAGRSLREAAIEGTGEVGLAIVASTGTTMVVFLPVMLMTENADASFFLRALGTPVIVSLAASLLVALVFTPLATRVVGHVDVRPDPGWLVRLTGAYDRLLALALHRRADAAMSMLAALLLTVTVAVPGVKCASGDDGGNLNDFVVRIAVPPDATPDERDAIARQFEAWVDGHREDWGVRVTRVHVDDRGTRGRLWVYLRDDGPLSREEVVEAARADLPDDVPGVTAQIGWEGQGGSDRQIQLALYGEDTTVLDALAEEALRRVRTVDGVLGAERSVDAAGLDEIRLRPDPAALERYGVTGQSLAQTVAFAMRGSMLRDLPDPAGDLDVETRVALEDRSDLGSLLDFPIWSPATMGIVPVRALTGIEMGQAAGSIQRKDRRTSTGITVDLAEDESPEEIVPALTAALDDMQLPRGYSWDTGNWQGERDEESSALFFALGMSVAFVFLLMGVLFESFVLPLAVITTIPMAILGAWWALWLTDTDLTTMGGIGLVVLVGVVVNNGIVLVDAVTQLRAEGMERVAAVREGSRRRLRPILMTALTTIVGLIPMAAGSSDFVGMPYAPLGRTVIGGMVASTLLTLLFVPYFYLVLDDVRTWSGKAWRHMWAL